MEAGNEVIRQLLTALFVLGILVAMVWHLRGRNAGTAVNRKAVGLAVRSWLKMTPPMGTIEVVERKALTPQHSLHRFQISGREFLIATHPQGCQLIAELDGKGQDSFVPTSGPASAVRTGGGA